MSNITLLTIPLSPRTAYWQTFDPYVIPLLDAPMDLRRFEEMDTSGSAASAHYHEEAKGDPSVGDMYRES
jgi:hypothetical protein